MNLNHFGYPFTTHVALFLGQIFNLSNDLVYEQIPEKQPKMYFLLVLISKY